ncbi:19650_t:CDS:2 [Funneliformis geosporum]|nr:19650_t:CDS:2 [Funneliformis geosporum]
MYFVDLFNQRRRKTEPKFVHILRACIILLLLALLLAYIIFLIIEVINSVPAIQFSIIETNEIPFPDTGKMIEIIDNNCNNSFIQPQQLWDDPPGYFGYFINNNNLKFTKNTKSGNQFIEIKLSANSYGDFIEIYLIDTEFNPLKLQDGKVDLESIQIIDHIRELVANNKYYLVNNQVSYIGLTRNQQKKIHSRFSGILGVSPSYNNLHRIVSNFQSLPFPAAPSTEYHSAVAINVASFRMQVETEQRTRTLLGIVGLMGGAWGLASALYAALFGVDMIRPWGCLQSYCGLRRRTYNKFKKRIPVLPLINSSSSMTELNSNSLDVKELRDHIISLEIFLKEYVVDVKFLEKSENIVQNDRSDDK